MSDDAIVAFARDLAEIVREAVEAEGGSMYEQVEFTRCMLEELADEGAVENPTLLWQEGTFGRTQYKISGYSMSEDNERLLLVATVYTGQIPPRRISPDEVITACDQALKFYECSCKGLYKEIEPANTDASDLARRIFEHRGEINVLRVLLLSDGCTGLKSVDLRKRKTTEDKRVIVDLYGIERLHRTLGQGLTRDDIILDFKEETGAPLNCLRISDASADYEAFLAAVPGSVLAAVYEKYGTRLLELNVRAFLGVKGGKTVNAGLRTTILKEPGRFLAYNNGIVATVDAIDTEDLGNGMYSISLMRGLQIVNGGQTTASLHRARQQDRANLENVTVPMKIIRVGGADLDQMVGAVSRSANSQNTIQPADFSANDPFHVTVEELANNAWVPGANSRWFYERARGSYGAAESKASYSAIQKRRFLQETPKSRRFNKTDLAKYLNTWDGLPHLVSFGNQKNFQFFMQALKDKHPAGWAPDASWYKAFIAKAIIFRATQAAVKAAKYPAYQANIAAYTVAALASTFGEALNLELIWRQQGLSLELSAMLKDWAVKIDVALRETSGGRMPSEWAKKADCWKTIRGLPLPLPSELPVEIDAQRITPNRPEGVQPGAAGPHANEDPDELAAAQRRA